MKLEDKPHSADVLGDWRDEWWARDYLGLVKERLGLGEVRSAVDVGCGKGHWGRALLPHLHPEAEMIGVDREIEWVEAATEAATEATTQATAAATGKARFLQGSAESLPLPDASADLITCQTLLMHVADVEAVLKEMLRVLRPGGLLLASEPTNLATHLIRDSVTRHYPPDRLVRMVDFFAHVAKGRASLGEGDECIGDRLPELFSGLGLEGIRAMHNERLACLVPPYTPAMRAFLGPYPGLVRERRWLYDVGYAKRYYLAGGGDEERFTLLHAEFLDQADTVIDAFEAGTYVSIMGHCHYLVAGRKPLS